jgi:hypothetical protein
VNSVRTRALSIVILLSTFGCATSRVVMSSKWDERSKPSYVDYVDAYLLGFVGKQRIDLRAVCMDQRPYAIQQGTTIQDGLFTLITLGIYAPTTIKVWCGN